MSGKFRKQCGRQKELLIQTQVSEGDVFPLSVEVTLRLTPEGREESTRPTVGRSSFLQGNHGRVLY